MSDDIVVKVDHVSMRFNLSSEKVDNMKEYFIKRQIFVLILTY